MVNPSTCFIPLVDPVLHTDILVYTATLNILKQDDYCEIYLPSLNINVWGVVISLLVSFTCFHWLCFFWKICDFKFTQLMFSHSNDKNYAKKKPFVNLFWFCFLYVYFGHMFYFILYSILLTLKDTSISESWIEKKIELNFYFHTSLWCLKRFYEGL